MILNENDNQAINLAVKSIKSGNLIIFPTDTIYGIVLPMPMMI